MTPFTPIYVIRRTSVALRICLSTSKIWVSRAGAIDYLLKKKDDE